MELPWTTAWSLGPGETLEMRTERLARGLDLVGMLASPQIVDLMELPSVPRNERLVKGVLTCAQKLIPMMDLRVNLNAADPRGTDRACALIVEVGGMQVGLIVAPGAEA